MASGDDEDCSQLKGVVFITLPPPDNPSLGKTITAFTLSNQPHQSPPLPPSAPQSAPPSHLPITLPHARRSLFGHPRRRISLTLMGIALFAILTFCSLQSPQSLLKLTSPGSLNELDQDDKDDDKNLIPSFFHCILKWGLEKCRNREIGRLSWGSLR